MNLIIFALVVLIILIISGSITVASIADDIAEEQAKERGNDGKDEDLQV